MMKGGYHCLPFLFFSPLHSKGLIALLVLWVALEVCNPIPPHPRSYQALTSSWLLFSLAGLLSLRSTSWQWHCSGHTAALRAMQQELDTLL
jgi:hypothetical protein